MQVCRSQHQKEVVEVVEQSAVVVTGLCCGLVVLTLQMPSAVTEAEADFAGVVMFGCLDAPRQVGSGCSEAEAAFLAFGSL